MPNLNWNSDTEFCLPRFLSAVFIIFLCAQGPGCGNNQVSDRGQHPVIAGITSPSPDKPLGAGTASFQWNAGIGASGYHLQIGTTGPGSADQFDQNTSTQRSRNVGGLPTDGRPIY